MRLRPPRFRSVRSDPAVLRKRFTLQTVDLHAVSRVENLANHRQPARHEAVTHVSGTNCYLCFRAGPRESGAQEGLDSNRLIFSNMVISERRSADRNAAAQRTVAIAPEFTRVQLRSHHSPLDWRRVRSHSSVFAKVLRRHQQLWRATSGGVQVIYVLSLRLIPANIRFTRIAPAAPVLSVKLERP